MKAIVIFLNCYVLLLSVLSCRDEEEFMLFPANKAVAVQTHQTSQADDICPPFCACACCGIHRTPAQTVQLSTSLNAPVAKEYSAYKIDLPGDISLSFWQPPKLA